MILLQPVRSALITILRLTNNAFKFTGGSAYAAGELIKKMGGNLLGFIFLLELEFLKGREKLPAPVYTLLSGQESQA